MDTNTLVNLIQTVTKTLNAEGFEHIALKHEGTSLTLNKKSVSNQATVVSPQTYSQPAPAEIKPAAPSQPVGFSTDGALAEKPVKEERQQAVSEVPEGDLKTIDSPIVGTFYNAPSPEAEAYVKVGDQVKKGDVVCIIEAMKLMNEIEAECDGEVVEICVQNEGPVEYGQVLFKLK